MVVHACNYSYLEDGGSRIQSLRPAQGELAKLCVKNEI
jgi:hypothetical protein